METPVIHVAIADDHRLFREGLALIINGHDRFRLLYDVADGQELMNRLGSSATLPDVVLLDLKMPVKDGMAVTEEIKVSFPGIKVLVLTMFHQDDYILHMLDLGANGYLLKNSSAEEVKRAILTVYEKDFYFNEHVSAVMLKGLKKKRAKPPSLEVFNHVTAREKEVLELLCQEHTTADIAERLFLSVRTVETHRKNLMHKLGAKNTAGLIIRAIKEGVIELN